MNATPSKAALKRAEIVFNLGPHMVGSDDEPKGETRIRADGVLEWKNPKTGAWCPAAPHDSFRQDFINMSSGDALYSQPPDRGIDPTDITSNCSFLGQNQWSFDPKGLKSIFDSEGNQVMCLERRPDRYQEYPDGPIWVHNGMVMLDQDDRPLLNYPGLPLVLSSQLEGSRMEALKRVFPWLKNADIRARMPRMVTKSRGERAPLSKFSTLGQRMTRFRAKAGLVPWNDRAGRLACKKRVIGDFAEDHMDFDGDTADDGSRSTKRQREDFNVDLGISGLENMGASFLSQDIPGNDQIGQQDTIMVGSTAFDGFEYPSPPHYQHLTNSYLSVPFHSETTTPFFLLVPRTTAEQQIIYEALMITRADFYSHHGFEAPMMPRHQAYLDQYNDIQALHAQQWVEGDSPPSLHGVVEWCSSFENWQVTIWAKEDVKQRLVAAGAVANPCAPGWIRMLCNSPKFHGLRQAWFSGG